MTRIALDELDEKIIERLGHDARVSNREIGREFGLTEGTIRSRLKRLLDGKVIRVAAVTNANRLRNPILAYLWVEANSASDIERVAEALAMLPEIGWLRLISVSLQPLSVGSSCAIFRSVAVPSTSRANAT